jgi:hypothetical protein
VTYTDVSTLSASVIDISTNSPPDAGSLTVSTQLGFALLTRVIASLPDWEDEDIPLTYSFSYTNDTYNNLSVEELNNGEIVGEYPITLLSGITTEFLLPIGSFAVAGYIQDSLGQSKHVESPVVMQENLDLRKIQETASAALTTDDHFASLHLMGAVSMVLNYTDFE